MLPERLSPEFAQALRDRRDELGYTRYKLACLSKLCPKLVKRYEIKGADFAIPNIRAWIALNIALDYPLPPAVFSDILEHIHNDVLALLKFSNDAVVSDGVLDSVKRKQPVQEAVQILDPGWTHHGCQTIWQSVQPYNATRYKRNPSAVGV